MWIGLVFVDDFHSPDLILITCKRNSIVVNGTQKTSIYTKYQPADWTKFFFLELQKGV